MIVGYVRSLTAQKGHEMVIGGPKSAARGRQPVGVGRRRRGTALPHVVKRRHCAPACGQTAPLRSRMWSKGATALPRVVKGRHCAPACGQRAPLRSRMWSKGATALPRVVKRHHCAPACGQTAQLRGRGMLKGQRGGRFLSLSLSHAYSQSQTQSQIRIQSRARALPHARTHPHTQAHRYSSRAAVSRTRPSAGSRAGRDPPPAGQREWTVRKERTRGKQRENKRGKVGERRYFAKGASGLRKGGTRGYSA